MGQDKFNPIAQEIERYISMGFIIHLLYVIGLELKERFAYDESPTFRVIDGNLEVSYALGRRYMREGFSLTFSDKGGLGNRPCIALSRPDLIDIVYEADKCADINLLLRKIDIPCDPPFKRKADSYAGSMPLNDFIQIFNLFSALEAPISILYQLTLEYDGCFIYLITPAIGIKFKSNSAISIFERFNSMTEVINSSSKPINFSSYTSKEDLLEGFYTFKALLTC